MARPAGIIETKPRQRTGGRLTRGQLGERLARLQALGVLQGTSRQVLAALNDSRYWLEVIGKLEEQLDYRSIAAILEFHQQQRDGRAPQQINVNSFNLSISAEDIAEARAIVRELQGLPPRDSADVHNGTDEIVRTLEHSPSVPQRMISESASDSLMVLGDEGGKAVG